LTISKFSGKLEEISFILNLKISDLKTSFKFGITNFSLINTINQLHSTHQCSKLYLSNKLIKLNFISQRLKITGLGFGSTNKNWNTKINKRNGFIATLTDKINSSNKVNRIIRREEVTFRIIYVLPRRRTIKIQKLYKIR